MIFEKLPFQFDVEKLRSHLREAVFPHPPHMVGNFFGGWSVTSSNGSYKDGWASGEKAMDPSFMPGSTLAEKYRAIGILKPSEYRHPTEVCFGYLKEVMDEIGEAGFNPLRARLSLLKAKGSSTLHRDAPDDRYSVRLHLPIITNEHCKFVCEDGSAHIPADGSAHLVRVNRPHQVFNNGDTDRIHLIMEVYDTKHLSTHHRYPKT